MKLESQTRSVKDPYIGTSIKMVPAGFEYRMEDLDKILNDALHEIQDDAKETGRTCVIHDIRVISDIMSMIWYSIG